MGSTADLRLGSDLEKRIQRLVESRSRSAQSIILEAVEQYVSREEEREKALSDAMASWEHYRTTGLHVTAEEADAWMAKLEAGEPAEAPECHE